MLYFQNLVNYLTSTFRKLSSESSQNQIDHVQTDHVQTDHAQAVPESTQQIRSAFIKVMRDERGDLKSTVRPLSKFISMYCRNWINLNKKTGISNVFAGSAVLIIYLCVTAYTAFWLPIIIYRLIMYQISLWYYTLLISLLFLPVTLEIYILGTIATLSVLIRTWTPIIGAMFGIEGFNNVTIKGRSPFDIFRLLNKATYIEKGNINPVIRTTSGKEQVNNPDNITNNSDDNPKHNSDDNYSESMTVLTTTEPPFYCSTVPPEDMEY